MDVSKNKGTPKWMVYFMENPIKMDDLGGGVLPPLFLETPKWINKQDSSTIFARETTQLLHVNDEAQQFETKKKSLEF